MTWKFLLLPIAVCANDPVADPAGLSYPALNVAADFSPAEADVEGYVNRGRFFSGFRNMIRSANSTLSQDSGSVRRFINSELNAVPTFKSSFAETDFPSITVTLVDEAAGSADSPIALLERFNISRFAHANDFDLCVQILAAQVEKLKVIAGLYSRARSGAAFLQMSNISQVGPIGTAAQNVKIPLLIARVSRGGVLAFQAMSTLLDYSNDETSLNLMKSMQLPMILNKLLISPKSRLSDEAQRLAATLRAKMTGLPSVTVKPGKSGGYGKVVMVLPRPSRVYAKDEMS